MVASQSGAPQVAVQGVMPSCGIHCVLGSKCRVPNAVPSIQCRVPESDGCEEERSDNDKQRAAAAMDASEPHNRPLTLGRNVLQTHMVVRSEHAGKNSLRLQLRMSATFSYKGSFQPGM